MPERVRITDVSPRDGLQNEPGVVASADKARLIGALARTGVAEVEVASFVSPRWIPQLADAEEVICAVAAAWAGEPPVMSALVPNEAGYERLLAANGRAGRRVVSKVSVFTAASEMFSKKNTNASIAETIGRFRAFVPRAAADGFAVRMYVSCAVACPFEGPIAPGAVRRVADALWAVCPTGELDLGDTIGVAHPRDIEALLAEFTPGERAALTLHPHDTFGRAASCVRAALDMGVRSFDGSAAGLGGCPYAGTKEKPAPGNIATETLVRAAHEAGFETGVDLGELERAAEIAREIVGRARLGAQASAGAAS